MTKNKCNRTSQHLFGTILPLKLQDCIFARIFNSHNLCCNGNAMRDWCESGILEWPGDSQSVASGERNERRGKQKYISVCDAPSHRRWWSNVEIAIGKGRWKEEKMERQRWGNDKQTKRRNIKHELSAFAIKCQWRQCCSIVFVILEILRLNLISSHDETASTSFILMYRDEMRFGEIFHEFLLRRLMSN